jgi:hypothetical protein
VVGRDPERASSVQNGGGRVAALTSASTVARRGEEANASAAAWMAKA